MTPAGAAPGDPAAAAGGAAGQAPGDAAAKARGRVGYQYVVLRCVPRVEREEFLNVGVVLYSQRRDFLDAAFRLDEARLSAFAPGLDQAHVRSALDTVCAICRGESRPGLPSLPKLGARFGWLVAPRSTVVQPGPVHGGLTDDPAAELARLLEQLVG